jgi:hypothetical protein
MVLVHFCNSIWLFFLHFFMNLFYRHGTIFAHFHTKTWKLSKSIFLYFICFSSFIFLTSLVMI